MKKEIHQRVIVSFELAKVASYLRDVMPVPVDLLAQKGMHISFDFCLHCLNWVSRPNFHNTPFCAQAPGLPADMQSIHAVVRDVLLAKKMESFIWMDEEREGESE